MNEQAQKLPLFPGPPREQTSEDMGPLIVIIAVVLSAYQLVRWYRWYNHHSIRHIRSPACDSWLLGTSSISYIRMKYSHLAIGNVRDFLHQESVGDLDFKFANEFGTAWRQKAPLGVC